MTSTRSPDRVSKMVSIGSFKRISEMVSIRSSKMMLKMASIGSSKRELEMMFTKNPERTLKMVSSRSLDTMRINTLDNTPKVTFITIPQDDLCKSSKNVPKNIFEITSKFISEITL